MLEGLNTVNRRHQTLYQALDWSYSLLSEPQKTLFRRLAIFSGSWTLAQAETVCTDEDLATSEIINLVSSLVNQSLVSMDKSGENGEIRYYFLETIRAYALEKLKESQDNRIWQRAVNYFAAEGNKLRYSNVIESRRYYSDALRILSYLPETVDQLRAKADLLISYLSVAFAAVDRPTIGSVIETMIARLEEIIDSENKRDDRLRLARLLFWLGYLAYFLEAIDSEDYLYWSRAITIAEDLQDQELVTLIKSTVGRILITQGLYRQAKSYLLEAYALLHNSQDWVARINTGAALALAIGTIDNFPDGITLAKKGVVEASQIGDLSRLGLAYNMLATNYLRVRDFSNAAKIGRKALKIIRQTDEPHNLVYSLYILALAEAYGHNFAQAQILLNELVALLKVTSYHGIGLAYGIAATVALFLDDYEQAKELAELGIDLSGRAKAKEGELICYSVMNILLSLNPEVSRQTIEERYQNIIARYEDLAIQPEVATMYENLAKYYLDCGDVAAADLAFETANGILENFGVPRNVIEQRKQLAKKGS
jgi:tetratricopeptide (TPR) repeat protein